MPNLRSAANDIKNPELLEILASFNPCGGTAPITVEQKRQSYRAAAHRSGPPDPVSSVIDRTISSRHDGAIPIRVYDHAPAQRHLRPVLLYLHGGGFLSGDLDTHDPVCRTLASRVHALVVAVEYRLAPEYPFPAGLQDCADVLEWLFRNAGEIGGDSNRILLAGDSAGGNLAAVLAILARDELGIAPLAQVLIYPMLDATLSSPSLVQNAFMPPFTLVDCVYAWQQYLNHDTDRQHPHVSPVIAADLRGLPPALVLTAEYDILGGEGQIYAGRLKAAALAVTHRHFSDMVHGFFQWKGELAAARAAMDCVVKYLSGFTT